MTADLYAAATGLIERSAAAYVSGVPEDAADTPHPGLPGVQIGRQGEIALGRQLVRLAADVGVQPEQFLNL